MEKEPKAKVDKLYRNYKYRIYPTEEQELLFQEYLDVRTDIWNAALRYSNSYYENNKKQPTKGEMMAAFNEYRNIRPPVRNLQAQCANEVIQDLLPKAYKSAFEKYKREGKLELPRHKRYGEMVGFRFPTIWNCGNQFIPRTQPTSINIERQTWKPLITKIKLPKELGEVRIVLHRPLPMPDSPEGYQRGRPTGLTIKRESDGAWHAIYSCEIHPDPFLEGLRSLKYSPTGEEVGMDAGITPNFGIFSDGEVIEAQRFYRDSQKKIRKLQKTLDRRTKKVEVGGKWYPEKKQSKRHYKARRALAKAHAKIARQRRDDHFKTASDLATMYDFVAVEDLNIKNMTKRSKSDPNSPKKRMYRKQKAGTTKGLLDCGFFQFRTILKTKMESVSKEYVEVPAAFTSQRCRTCGKNSRHNPGSKFYCRNERCSDHNVKMDRDVNAAKNILDRGRQSPNE